MSGSFQQQKNTEFKDSSVYESFVNINWRYDFNLINFHHRRKKCCFGWLIWSKFISVHCYSKFFFCPTNVCIFPYDNTMFFGFILCVWEFKCVIILNTCASIIHSRWPLFYLFVCFHFFLLSLFDIYHITCLSNGWMTNIV